MGLHRTAAGDTDGGDEAREVEEQGFFIYFQASPLGG